uniref:Nucleoside-diphosphate kinase n=1 Tax=Sphenodon punctatus TaxID=8508 RepID=A0A8D0GUN1_SPHPU
MIASFGDTKGFLIDGYPREIKQGKAFENKIGEPSLVLCLDCSTEIMSSRLLKRSQNSQRIDDNADTIVKRIENYYQALEPVIAYYEQKTQLCKINAEGTPEEVFLQVCTSINSFLKKEEAASCLSTEIQ